MYNNKLGSLMLAPSAGSLASAASIFSFVALAKIQVKRFGILITTATVSTGTIVVKVYKRNAPGVTASQVQVGVINIPTAAAVGSVYYEEFSSGSNIAASLLPGQCLDFDVTTAAAGGSAAGAGIAVPEEIEESPDVVANYSNHIAG